jgi:DNA-binding CsgD family transcriptional regulator
MNHYPLINAVFSVDLDEVNDQFDRILTPRERDVATLMGQGLANREIAEQLRISPKTLDIHRANVSHKLQTKVVGDITRAYLARQAAAALEQLPEFLHRLGESEDSRAEGRADARDDKKTLFALATLVSGWPFLGEALATKVLEYLEGYREVEVKRKRPRPAMAAAK